MRREDAAGRGEPVATARGREELRRTACADSRLRRRSRPDARARASAKTGGSNGGQQERLPSRCSAPAIAAGWVTRCAAAPRAATCSPCWAPPAWPPPRRAACSAAAREALAQTPRRGGRIRVAGVSTSTSDTLDPAKQSLSTDYARCNMFYNGLTSLDGRLAPQPALAESWETPGRHQLDLQAAQGRRLPRRQGAGRRRRRLLAEPPQGPRRRLPRPLARRADGGGEGDRRRTRCGSPSRRRTPTCRWCSAPSTSSSSRTARPTSPPPIGTGPYRCKEFTPGVRSVARAQRELLEAGQALSRRDRVHRHPGRAGAGERAAFGRHPPHRRHQPALRAPHLADAGLRGVRDQVGLLHRPRHPPGQRAGQQPGLRPAR